MSDAEDLIYFSPKRKLATRMRGFGELRCSFVTENGFQDLSVAFSGSGAVSATGYRYPITLTEFLTSVGARMRFLFWAGRSAHTVTGAGLSQMNDLGPSGLHAVQGTDANRPAYNATGGPNGLSCISPQSAARYLLNSTISIPTDRALTLFKVVKAPTNATTAQAMCRDNNNPTVGNIVDVSFGSVTAQWSSVIRCNGQSEETKTITSPANDGLWHINTLRYAASIAPAMKVSNVAVSPAHTSLGRATAIESVTLGHPSVSGGHIAVYGCIEDCTSQEEYDFRSIIGDYYSGAVT